MSDLELFRTILLVFSAPFLIINLLLFVSQLDMPKEARVFGLHWDAISGTPPILLALTYMF